jgi:transposase
MRVAPKVELDAGTERELRILSKRRRVEARVQQRARIVLLAAAGWCNKDIAAEVGLHRRQVGLWRQRFIEGGIEAIRQEAPRPGRTPRVTAEVEARIVNATLHEQPPAATHWSSRRLAKYLGLSATTIRRVWRRNGLKPHRCETFKLSRDPKFVDKLHDVVGLYLNPPEHALVFSCDEKSQIQALDRTQPGSPLKRGRAALKPHDYKRNGTTTLFAALNVLDGKVLSMCQPQHRHEEWLKFLRLIDRNTPKHLTVHLIVDNYSNKHPKVQAWLAKHPRFVMHFTPTSASWLNMVERFFRDLSEQRIKRGSLASVAELERAIAEYIDQHNANPNPFVFGPPRPTISSPRSCALKPPWQRLNNMYTTNWRSTLGFIKACEARLPPGHRIAHVRLDAAGYQAEEFDRCEDTGKRFAIGARLDAATRRASDDIPESACQRYADCAVAETVHSMGGTKKALRPIVVKYLHQGELFDEQARYHVIASNRVESAQQTLLWYRQRGAVSENGIEELEIGFGMQRMPCGQVEANAVFLRIGAIAHNLFVLFEHAALDAAWQRHTVASVRWRPFHLPGKLVRHAGAWVLKVAAERVDLFRSIRARSFAVAQAMAP